MNTLRRNFLAVDVMVLVYLAALIAIVLASAPGQHTGELMFFLGGMTLAYLGLQRIGIDCHRRTEGRFVTGKAPPLLRLLALVHALSPLAIIPMSFLKLGFIIEDAGWLISVTHHADFVAAAGWYDPDNASSAGLQLGPHGAATYYDHVLKNADISLFGVYPPQWMRDNLHMPWLTGVLQVCYLSYYLAPPIAGIPLLVRGRIREFRLVSAVIAGCLIATYFGYLFVPATGPRFEGGTPRWMPAEDGWFGASTIYRAIDGAETFRWDAFPSGHVAVSLTALLLMWRFTPKTGMAMTLPVLGLCLSTVYMGYHYGVDVIAGIAFMAVSLWLLPRFTSWWERPLWPAVDGNMVTFPAMGRKNA